MLQSLLLPCKPVVGFTTNIVGLRSDFDWKIVTKGLADNKVKLFVLLPDQAHWDSGLVNVDTIIPGGAKVYMEIVTYNGPDLISIHAEGIANGT